MNSVVSTDPEVLSGAAVFKGTRVPIKNLFDYIEGGHPLSEFFEDFPSVTPQQVEHFFKELQDQAVSKAA